MSYQARNAVRQLENCYIVTGITYPYKPSLWKTKKEALSAAVKLRKALRAKYPRHFKPAEGIVVEHRYVRDMIYLTVQKSLADWYNT